MIDMGGSSIQCTRPPQWSPVCRPLDCRTERTPVPFPSPSVGAEPPATVDEFAVRRYRLPLTTGLTDCVQLLRRPGGNPKILGYASTQPWTPRFAIELAPGSEIINNITEFGPCVYLMSPTSGEYEFQCSSWEVAEKWLALMLDLGVKPRSFDEMYELRSIVGEGGFGKVYSARHRLTGGIVCLKSIEKRRSQGDSHQSTLELALMRRLKHPCIVELYAGYEDQKFMHLVMEFCFGGELYSYLRERKEGITETDARTVMKRLLLALEFLHSNGILHRDVKTENLLLARKTDISSVKLIDFGLATTSADGSGLMMRCGSPGYVAPEILSGQPGQYSTKVDVFSAGAVAFTLITGHPPFQGASQKEVIAKNVACTLDFSGPKWNTVTQECLEAVAWMLEKHPPNRCTATEALGHRWLSSDGASTTRPKYPMPKRSTFNEAQTDCSVSAAEVLASPRIARESLDERMASACRSPKIENSNALAGEPLFSLVASQNTQIDQTSGHHQGSSQMGQLIPPSPHMPSPRGIHRSSLPRTPRRLYPATSRSSPPTSRKRDDTHVEVLTTSDVLTHRPFLRAPKERNCDFVMESDDAQGDMHSDAEDGTVDSCDQVHQLPVARLEFASSNKVSTPRGSRVRFSNAVRWREISTPPQPPPPEVPLTARGKIAAPFTPRGSEDAVTPRVSESRRPLRSAETPRRMKPDRTPPPRSGTCSPCTRRVLESLKLKEPITRRPPSPLQILVPPPARTYRTSSVDISKPKSKPDIVPHRVLTFVPKPLCSRGGREIRTNSDVGPTPYDGSNDPLVVAVRPAAPSPPSVITPRESPPSVITPRATTHSVITPRATTHSVITPRESSYCLKHSVEEDGITLRGLRVLYPDESDSRAMVDPDDDPPASGCQPTVSQMIVSPASPTATGPPTLERASRSDVEPAPPQSPKPRNVQGSGRTIADPATPPGSQRKLPPFRQPAPKLTGATTRAPRQATTPSYYQRIGTPGPAGSLSAKAASTASTRAPLLLRPRSSTATKFSERTKLQAAEASKTKLRARGLQTPGGALPFNSVASRRPEGSRLTGKPFPRDRSTEKLQPSRGDSGSDRSRTALLPNGSREGSAMTRKTPQFAASLQRTFSVDSRSSRCSTTKKTTTTKSSSSMQQLSSSSIGLPTVPAPRWCSFSSASASRRSTTAVSSSSVMQPTKPLSFTEAKDIPLITLKKTQPVRIPLSFSIPRTVGGSRRGGVRPKVGANLHKAALAGTEEHTVCRNVSDFDLANS